MKSIITHDKNTKYYCIHIPQSRRIIKKYYISDEILFSSIVIDTGNVSCEFWRNLHSTNTANLILSNRFYNRVQYINILSKAERELSLYTAVRSMYDIVHNNSYMANNEPIIHLI